LMENAQILFSFSLSDQELKQYIMRVISKI